MLSRRGVTHDFDTSPYIYICKYDEDVVEFIFSSKININKFDKLLLNNRIEISTSLTNRFKIEVNMDVLADIILYRKIEHRGFLIKINGEVVKWLNIIKLDGRIRMLNF